MFRVFVLSSISAICLASCTVSDKSTERRLEALETRLKQLDLPHAESSGASAVTLRFEGKGYQTVKCANGLALFLAGEVAEPYLDGYRIKFLIGNPYSSAFGNTDIEISWGKENGARKATGEPPRRSRSVPRRPNAASTSSSPTRSKNRKTRSRRSAHSSRSAWTPSSSRPWSRPVGNRS